MTYGIKTFKKYNGLIILLLWISCLFIPHKTKSIHIALIVELVFFLQYVLAKKKPATGEPIDIKDNAGTLESINPKELLNSK